jgi:hypothetical protein
MSTELLETTKNKHYLWQGNVDKACECLGLLLFELEAQHHCFPAAAKLVRGVTEFIPPCATIRNSLPHIAALYAFFWMIIHQCSPFDGLRANGKSIRTHRKFRSC